jgi:hypothetical protein
LSTGFYCFAPVSAGQFTVPPSILLGMLPGAGITEVLNNTALQRFTAPGMDIGFASAGSIQLILTAFK